MSLWQWSTTPSNNASGVTNVDWAEGQPPSTVNDSARQMMADVAAWYASPEWVAYGDTPTYVSGTSFTVAGNLTSRYSVGRRVRTTNTGGTLYGMITASTYTSLTTVTVSMDSGALDSGLSKVDVAILNGSVSAQTLTTTGGVSSGGVVVNSIDTNGANIKLNGNGTSTPSKTLRAKDGVFQIVNNAYSGVPMSMDDAGNVTFTGNITASSDERLKADWQPMPTDFLECLATLKRGTFTRIDSGQRQVGVGAQSLQAFMPEAVQGDERLSVAYGQAALVACAELAQEVLRLRALLEPVK